MIDNRYKRISRVVESQFPSHVRSKYPNLVGFIVHYYKWLEDSELLSEIYSLTDTFDIDKAHEKFLYYFEQEYAPKFPSTYAADKRIVLKYISDFYNSKGTEDSIKFIFRILFNEEITVEYPNEFILRASDGVFSKNNIIKISAVSGIENVLGRKLFGKISNASAIVDNITITSINSYPVAICTVKNITKNFDIAEEVETKDNSAKVSSTISGILKSTTINNGGANYAVGEVLLLPNSVFSNATIEVEEIDSNGKILSLKVTDSGLGYSANFTLSNVNGKGANVTFSVGTIYYDKGSFTSDRGKLSSSCKIQDGHRYQDFSYVIKSSRNVADYSTILKNTVHPAGVLLLGEVTILAENIVTNDFVEYELLIGT